MTRGEIRRSEELLMELIFTAVASETPARHEHDEYCYDDVHTRLDSYQEGWDNCIETLRRVIESREEVWEIESLRRR